MCSAAQSKEFNHDFWYLHPFYICLDFQCKPDFELFAVRVESGVRDLHSFHVGPPPLIGRLFISQSG